MHIRGHKMETRQAFNSAAICNEEIDKIKNIVDYQKALLRIVHHSSDDLLSTSHFITEQLSQTLNVERVSFWTFSSDRKSITCQNLYTATNGEHTHGMSLSAEDYPNYFSALHNERIIDASDARSDPRSFEFNDNYLIPLGIVSMLDVPVWSGGKVIGIMCHEHVGEKRRWTREECDFTSSAADLMALAIEGIERRKAEKSLKAEKEWSETIINLAPDIVVGLGENSKIVIFNKFAERLTGYKANEVIGRSWIETFIPSDQRPDISKIWNDVVKSRSIDHHFENEIITKDGRHLLISWNNSVLTDDNVFRMVLSIGEDVTTERRIAASLKESELKYRTLIENANDAIFLVNLETRKISDVNIVSEELLGISRSDIIGSKFDKIFPDGVNPLSDLTNCNSTEKMTRKIVTLVKDRSGTPIPVQLSNSIISINERNYLLSIVRDITEFKEAENALKRDRSDLKNAVSEKNQELRRMLKQLDDAKRLADIGTLSATVAHELRNPLGVIRTATFNIRKKNKNADLEKHLLSIEKKIFDSDKIINNLLSYSRIKMPEVIDMPIVDLVNECIDNVKEKYSNDNVEIQIHIHCSAKMIIQADRVHMTELLTNLLDNACLAIAPNKGTVKIFLEFDDKENNIDLKVKDDGVGMDKEAVAKAFDPFFTRRINGIGLGLTVCQQVVSLHGGSIDIQSKEGKGTVVTVKLPVKKNLF